MMEFFLEILAQIFIEGLLFFPGAFIRWVWFGRKKKFMDFIDDYSALNYIVSLAFWFAIILTALYFT